MYGPTVVLEPYVMRFMPFEVPLALISHLSATLLLGGGELRPPYFWGGNSDHPTSGGGNSDHPTSGGGTQTTLLLGGDSEQTAQRQLSRLLLLA